MGTIPGSGFEAFRVRMSAATVPAWTLRFGVGVAVLLGLLVALLLLPLLLFGALLLALWVGVNRVRSWAAGVRGRIAGDSEGRRNVRVLVRDA